MASEKVKPLIVKDTENHTEYTLEFNRDAIRFADARGFKIEDVADFPMTKIYELWFYAFRMHHKKVARDKTDALLDELCAGGGLPKGLVERLAELYAAPFDALFGDDEEGDESGEAKNASVVVEF
jgi:hypothetical protein